MQINTQYGISFSFNGAQPESVSDFTYLGNTITTYDRHTKQNEKSASSTEYRTAIYPNKTVASVWL